MTGGQPGLHPFCVSTNVARLVLPRPGDLHSNISPHGPRAARFIALFMNWESRVAYKERLGCDMGSSYDQVEQVEGPVEQASQDRSFLRAMC